MLIDEVGRGTSVREGVAISHAIAEELIRLKVNLLCYVNGSSSRLKSLLQSFVFFATSVPSAFMSCRLDSLD